MAAPTPLFCHTASVMTSAISTEYGRSTVTWIPAGEYACRFSSPKPSVSRPAPGSVIDRIDAVIYVGPELEPVIRETSLPVRFVTETKGWTGTYEVRTPPAWYTSSVPAVHHGACSAVRVTGGDRQ